MNDAEKLKIARAALNRIVNECETCRGTGRERVQDGYRIVGGKDVVHHTTVDCHSCATARQAMRDTR